MSDAHPAVPFSKVLNDELEEIRAARAKRKVLKNVPNDGDSIHRAQHAELLGLAFSGGGIRSATFNLGVLQGLAAKHLLREVDYFSTVSGGGYIGAWFISRLRGQGTEDQVQKLEDALSPACAAHPESKDQEPIEFLRQYSNYLTPRLAFYSADVWTMAATWTRNFVLNLLLLIAAIGTILIVPRLLGLLFAARYGPLPLVGGVFDVFDAIVTVLLLVIAGGVVCRNFIRKESFDQKIIQLGVVMPLVLATAFLARWLQYSPGFFTGASFWGGIRCPLVFFALTFASIILSFKPWVCFLEEHPKTTFNETWSSFQPSGAVMKYRAFLESIFQPVWTRIGWVVLLLLASILPAFLVALMLWGLATGLESWHSQQAPWCLFAFGPPALIAVISIGMVVLIGMLGLELDTSTREWFGRLRAWTIIYSAGWMIVFGGSIYGPLWIIQLINLHPWMGSGLSVGWIATTLSGVLFGKSSKPAVNQERQAQRQEAVIRQRSG